jgi:hypothetical protein
MDIKIWHTCTRIWILSGRILYSVHLLILRYIPFFTIRSLATLHILQSLIYTFPSPAPSCKWLVNCHHTLIGFPPSSGEVKMLLAVGNVTFLWLGKPLDIWRTEPNFAGHSNAANSHEYRLITTNITTISVIRTTSISINCGIMKFCVATDLWDVGLCKPCVCVCVCVVCRLLQARPLHTPIISQCSLHLSVCVREGRNGREMFKNCSRKQRKTSVRIEIVRVWKWNILLSEIILFYFICGLFINAISSLDYISCNVK